MARQTDKQRRLALPAGKSGVVVYALAAVTAVVYALFALVGYDRPFDDDPNFNAPLFTDALLWLMFAVLVAAIVAAVWAGVRGVRNGSGGKPVENNIPVRRITIAVAAGTLLLLLLTFVFGSSAPMKINGSEYADGFWLRATDMFISSSLLLMAAAAVAVVFGMTKTRRK